jgi:hypothetical protein
VWFICGPHGTIACACVDVNVVHVLYSMEFESDSEINRYDECHSDDGDTESDPEDPYHDLERDMHGFARDGALTDNSDSDPEEDHDHYTDEEHSCTDEDEEDRRQKESRKQFRVFAGKDLEVDTRNIIEGRPRRKAAVRANAYIDAVLETTSELQKRKRK